MLEKTKSVKVEVETLELLKKLKAEQGINMSSAITIAVREKYGKKNSK